MTEETVVDDPSDSVGPYSHADRLRKQNSLDPQVVAVLKAIAANEREIPDTVKAKIDAIFKTPDPLGGFKQEIDRISIQKNKSLDQWGELRLLEDLYKITKIALSVPAIERQ